MLHRTARDANHRIAWSETRGKGIDPPLVVEQVDRRGGRPRCDGHFFHDVQQLALAGFHCVPGKESATELLGHHVPAAPELSDLVETPAPYDRSNTDNHGQQDLGVPPLRKPHLHPGGRVSALKTKKRDHEPVNQDPHRDHGANKKNDETPGLPARDLLAFKEVDSQGQLERDLRTLGNGLAIEFEKSGVGSMAEGARQDHRRKALLRRVVESHGVVEGLSRKSHLVLGGGQFFGQLHHVRVRLEIRVGLRQREHSSQGSAQGPLGTGQPLHGRRVTRGTRGSLKTRAGIVSRLDDRLERLPFVLDIALRGFDEIGNQVVATFQLNFDLRKSIRIAILQ